MSGLRYRDMSPFISGRDQKINGTSYLRGEPVPMAALTAIKHLDALISQHRLVPTQYPYVGAPGRDPQPVHVPKIEREYLAVAGTDALRDAPDDSEESSFTVSLGGVPTGTVDEVLDWVGYNAERAAQALEHELANKNRSTLIHALEQITGSE